MCVILSTPHFPRRFQLLLPEAWISHGPLSYLPAPCGDISSDKRHLCLHSRSFSMCRCPPTGLWLHQALGAAKSQVRCSDLPETSEQHKYIRHKTFRKMIPFWSGSWKVGGTAGLHIWRRSPLLGSRIVSLTSERNPIHPVHASLLGHKNLSSSFL